MFLPASLQSSIMEMLDREIEAQLRCWHQNPDMMYSIHPIDGSFLIWYTYTPCSTIFRVTIKILCRTRVCSSVHLN